MKKYNKVIVGYVVQQYMDEICNSQSFMAGNQIDYEDGYGESIDVPCNEIYQPLDMVQPGLDYYFIEVWGCVEPNLVGPYNTADKRDKALKDKIDEIGEENNTFFGMEANKGARVTI